MSQIGEIKKLSDTRFLNFYEFEAVPPGRNVRTLFCRFPGKENRAAQGRFPREQARRRRSFRRLRGEKGQGRPRPPVPLPAGGLRLRIPRRSCGKRRGPMAAAGIREMYEETGLTFTPVDAGACSRPFFTTIGMTDESCGTVFGYCSGEPTSAHQESSEDIQVILADRAECKRILREKTWPLCARTC